MAATSCVAFDPSWYPNSGATNHIIPGAIILFIKNSYTGPDKTNVGDGTSVTIDHIGSSSFCS